MILSRSFFVRDRERLLRAYQLDSGHRIQRPCEALPEILEWLGFEVDLAGTSQIDLAQRRIAIPSSQDAPVRTLAWAEQLARLRLQVCEREELGTHWQLDWQAREYALAFLLPHHQLVQRPSFQMLLTPQLGTAVQLEALVADLSAHFEVPAGLVKQELKRLHVLPPRAATRPTRTPAARPRRRPFIH